MVPRWFATPTVTWWGPRWSATATARVQVILSSRALLGPVKSFTTVRVALAVVEHPFSTDERL